MIKAKTGFEAGGLDKPGSRGRRGQPHDTVIRGGVVAAIGAALAALVYGRSRSVLTHVVDGLIVAPARERAALAAAEEEKARLARQIHDEPLQTLSGVIRRLEVQPVAPDDIEALRATARHLRNVATELNPPVLEDLGLGPAITHLVDTANGQHPTCIELELTDDADRARASRLPSEVEIALYRIVQEALNNAETHSRATHVRVTARLSPEAAEVEVLDDGIGIGEREVRRARWDGHFGVAGMRHRAESIGARLRIGDVVPRGTRVAAVWPAR
jgi:signal transduction histidine kinase